MSSQVTTFLLELIKEAGTLAASLQKESLTVNNKSAKDLVTNADVAVERMIIEKILEFMPNAQMLAEESASSAGEGTDPNAPHLWIIDPIDGTTNFAFGHPHFAISIAYAEFGRVICGAVYAPRLNELFHAEQGAGAFLNGERLVNVPAFNPIVELALVAVGRACCPEEELEHTRRVEIIYKNALDVRRAGAGSLDICWIATGRLHAFFETLHPWDVAAGVLIAKETGCEKVRFAELSDYHSKWLEVPDDMDGRNFLIAHPGATALIASWLRR
jgi:myo-inositol-1(or 4)-monophosphatase